MPEKNGDLALYYYPGTRATRARWILEELGVDYEPVLVNLTKGAQREPGYRMIHPLGQVPALKHGDSVVYESLGICLYLADRFPDSKLAPELADPDRPTYCQWMAFSMGAVEPGLLAVRRAKHHPDELGEVERDFQRIVDVLDGALAGKAFLLGGHISAADIMNGSMMTWARSLDLIPSGSQVEQWVQRLTERPGYRRATADGKP